MDVRAECDQMRVAASAVTEKIDAGLPVTVTDMAVGTAFAQGDIAVWRIDAMPRRSAKIDRPSGGQVAPGTSRGSRHCIPEDAPVTYYRIIDGDPLSDLGIVATGPWPFTHPEHADYTFPAGTFRFVHQQNELRQRVVD